MFLKIDNLELGATLDYTATKKNFDNKIRMASNKMITEKRPAKWEMKANFEYLTDKKRKELYTLLDNEPQQGFLVEFYNNKGEIETAYFTVTDIPAPQILTFKKGLPWEWVNIGFTLEEI